MLSEQETMIIEITLDSPEKWKQFVRMIPKCSRCSDISVFGYQKYQEDDRIYFCEYCPRPKESVPMLWSIAWGGVDE